MTSSPPATAPPASSLSLLVVEDDDALRDTLVDMLELHGHRVTAAPNGFEGLRLAREIRPDLVITDIAMPIMDGYELVAALRAEPTIDATPVIFLTAKIEREDVRRGMEMGGDDYLTKPFTEAELVGAIQARCARRASIERRVESEIGNLRKVLRESLSHELLTPLNGILGFASLLEECATSIKRERLVEWSRLIRESGERQLSLVRKVLAHADVEMLAGDPDRLAALRAEVARHAGGIIEQAAAAAASGAHRPEDLRLEVDDAAIGVAASVLDRVVAELVDNAVRFSPKGSPVRVTGRVQGGLYVLTVADAGRGMTPAQIEAIAPFMQFERDQLQQRGLGLGLSIARRLVLLHGGGFRVESEVGRGTTVTLELPLALPLA